MSARNVVCQRGCQCVISVNADTYARKHCCINLCERRPTYPCFEIHLLGGSLGMKSKVTRKGEGMARNLTRRSFIAATAAATAALAATGCSPETAVQKSARVAARLPSTSRSSRTASSIRTPRVRGSLSSAGRPAAASACCRRMLRTASSAASRPTTCTTTPWRPSRTVVASAGAPCVPCTQAPSV